MMFYFILIAGNLNSSKYERQIIPSEKLENELRGSLRICF